MGKIIHHLQQIKGIGETTANTIVDELAVQSLKDLSELDEGELKKVKGIGPKTARRILEDVKEILADMEVCENCGEPIESEGSCTHCEEEEKEKKDINKVIEKVENSIQKGIEAGVVVNDHRAYFEKELQDIHRQISHGVTDKEWERLYGILRDIGYLKKTNKDFEGIKDIWKEQKDHLSLDKYSKDIDKIEEELILHNYKNACEKANGLLSKLEEEKKRQEKKPKKVYMPIAEKKEKDEPREGKVNGLRARDVEIGGGLVNGRKSAGPVKTKRRKTERKKAPVALFVITLIIISSFAFFLFYSPFEDDERMVIDGDFEDWREIDTYSFQLEEISSSVSIEESAVTTCDERLFFYIRTEEEILVGDEEGNMDSFYFFLNITTDEDQNHYYTPTIKANYLVKVQGWENEIFGAVYQYENRTDQRNWNDWEIIGNIDVAKVENELEFSIPHVTVQDEEDVEIYIVSRDSKGVEAHSDHVIVPGKPSLSIYQHSPVNDHVISPDEDILVLNLTARGDEVTVQDISFNGNFETVEVDVDYPLLVEKNTSIRITVNGTATPDEIITVQVKDVETEAVTTISGEPRSYYFEEVSYEAQIDGVFVEWEDLKEEHSVEYNLPANVDIIEYGYIEEDIFFYVKTRGRVLQGTAIPEGVDVYTPDYEPDPVEPDPVVERISGEDEVIFYIDEDGSGMLYNGSDADRKVVVRGQYGEILYVTSYYNENGEWIEEESEPECAKWYNQLEIYAGGTSFETGLIKTINWEGRGDRVVLSPHRSVRNAEIRDYEELMEEMSEVLISYGIGDGDFEYSWWDGENWGGTEEGQIGGPEIQWLVNRQNPTLEEKIIAVQVEDADGGVHIFANVWNGTDWTGAEPIAMNIGVDSTHRVFDVAYEGLTGQGHIIYYNATADEDEPRSFFNYRTWDRENASWSEEIMYDLARAMCQIDWIETSSSPVSDDIAIFLTAYNTFHFENNHRVGLIWDGNEMIDLQALDDGPVPAMNGEILPSEDITFDNAGNALFVWGRDGSSQLYMRLWRPEEGWGTEFSYDIGGEGRWISVAPDPSGDGMTIAVSYETENSWPLKTLKIEDNNFVDETTHDQDTFTLGNRCFDLLYDSSVQDTVILVWGTEEYGYPVYRRYHEGNWGEIGSITYENVDYPERIQLIQDTRGDIFLVAMMDDTLASWTYNRTEDSWDFQMEHTNILSGIDTSIRLEPFMISPNIPEFTSLGWFIVILLCITIFSLVTKKKE